MPQTAIVLPVIAMVALTVVVATTMFLQRVGEMRRRRIHPQKMATSASRGQRLESTTAADNFSNLFELPVLFYVLCLALLATGTVTEGMVWAAWGFVALRVLHSLIHCSWNTVMHRFAAYVAGMLVLVAMWGVFAARLLGG